MTAETPAAATSVNAIDAKAAAMMASLSALAANEPLFTALANLDKEAKAAGSSLEQIIRTVAKDRLGILK